MRQEIKHRFRVEKGDYHRKGEKNLENIGIMKNFLKYLVRWAIA